MSKATVTKLFLGSALVALVGTTLAIAAVSIALANDVFVMNGPDVVGIQGSGLSWALAGLGTASGLAIAGGLIGGLVSWIGALLNTAQLDRKAWFVGLLLLGIFNLGILGMIAYLIAGPDGTTTARRPVVPASAAA
jgi:hypothetical protein